MFEPARLRIFANPLASYRMLNIPNMSGVIRRRLLLNYRIDPQVVAPLLPKGFRPKLVRGHAIGGICLIRLEKLRPKGFPSLFGIASENSAHRFAVEWEDDSEGVFVPRRDTDSRLNSLAGGRIFPGVHRFSQFSIQDQDQNDEIEIAVRHQNEVLLEVAAREAQEIPADSIFSSLQESSDFFEAGCVGYSSRPNSCTLDGLLLKVDDWQASALTVSHIRSRYFEDLNLFPEGSITFDHGLLMRDIPHQWLSKPIF